VKQMMTEMTIRTIAAIATAGMLAASIGRGCAQPVAAQSGLVRIPLHVSHNARLGVYKATIDIGIGNLPPVPMGFDTGSTGLHVFAAVGVQRPGSGVNCSATPVTFTVGNPGKLTYSGVLCDAVLHYQGFTAPAAVPIAYLTSVACAPDNPGCKIPDLDDPKAHGGTYGVFGAGITGPMPVLNPILALQAPFGSSFAISLTHNSGELDLGASAPAEAVPFHLPSGSRAGERWKSPQTCIFVNGASTTTCLTISFDTGNGVPWIRDSQSSQIPQSDGFVTPGTMIGFGPSGAHEESTSVVAGTSFADKIKVEPTTGAPLTNTGIAAFFDHVFTYDAVHGIISVSTEPSAR
jgi:hypothetical protein